MSIPLENAERRVDETARRFFSPDARFQRPGLTAMRALAAFLVVAFHMNHYVVPRRLEAGALDFTPLVTIGWAGVNVFFVLSGFLITLHVAERLSRAPAGSIYPAYLRDRILRVVPAYWAQIALLFIAAWIAAGSPPPWAAHIPAHLVFLQNLSMTSHAAINGVYWSLPVEFSFYLVAPVMVSLAWPAAFEPRSLARRAFALAAAGVAISAAWRAFALAQSAGAGQAGLFWLVAAHLPGTFEQFAIGAAAAMLFAARGLPDATRDARWARAGDALLVAGVAGFVAALYVMDARFTGYWSGSPLFYAWGPLAAVAVALAIAGVASRGPLARLAFENAPMVWLGTISYSVYLWHPVLLAPLARESHASQGGLGAFSVVALPAVVAAAAASYYLVERPFLRRKRGTAATARTLQ